MGTPRTTISCRAIALTALALAGLATASLAAEQHPPPKLPVTTLWSVDVGTAVSGPPVTDGERVYLALRSGGVAARAIADGRELWRASKNVNAWMASDGGLLFVSAGDAIEALRGTDGASTWVAPGLKVSVPLVASGGFVVAITAAEVVAIRAADGQVAWRRAAGGVRHAPAVDGERVFVGADDGRVLALDLASGSVVWEQYVDRGVTAIVASRGLVYTGAGDKRLYCRDAATGAVKWLFRVGALVSGAMAVDEDRVYFAALDNVVRALDRATGNQRWQAPLSKRPVAGVIAAGRVVFVQVSGTELVLLLDRDGRRSGTIPLPGESTRDTPAAIRETPAGLNVFVVTGGLSNQWQLTFIGPAAEPALEPFGRAAMPGVAFLTDPLPEPIARVLPWLVLGDPILQPLSAVEWPIVLHDPPLQPLTTLPGIQLRPLSPVLPARRGA